MSDLFLDWGWTKVIPLSRIQAIVTEELLSTKVQILYPSYSRIWSSWWEVGRETLKIAVLPINCSTGGFKIGVLPGQKQLRWSESCTNQLTKSKLPVLQHQATAQSQQQLAKSKLPKHKKCSNNIGLAGAIRFGSHGWQNYDIHFKMCQQSSPKNHGPLLTVSCGFCLL